MKKKSKRLQLLTISVIIVAMLADIALSRPRLCYTHSSQSEKTNELLFNTVAALQRQSVQLYPASTVLI